MLPKTDGKLMESACNELVGTDGRRIGVHCDLLFTYDHVGRVVGTKSGLMTNSEFQTVPAYEQTMAFDAFNNMAGRKNETWGQTRNFSAFYTNNRRTAGGQTYDALGNIFDNIGSSITYDRWTFDAAGRMSRWVETGPYYNPEIPSYLL